MGYTPELSDYHSSTLKRVAWALGKPMTKTIDSLFDSLDRIVDPGKVCERCRDRSHCDSCYFKTRERINGHLPVDPILLAGTEAARVDNHGISMEAIMKVNQVSVLVSKKIGKNFCSWSVSYGATADVEEEHYTEAIAELDTRLREMVSTALPTPNGHRPGEAYGPEGNGNGNGHPAIGAGAGTAIPLS